MKAQHTPGPWTVDEVRTDSGRAFRIGSGEMLRAGKGCCIIYDDHGGGDNERKANATLIGTSPELLAVLRSIVFQVAQGKVLERDACITEARAAIAKATGAA